ncbi:ATP phosphoribosyltransferase [Sphaceloma murrayae]|uniref:ATP phosphoribosyltransferase n=1 Tax=Sphaceloma murrayae TaxID=2082308 RepID=A0A2K1QZT3_9PEZI|nr:ATP phosphoribosyltransferase [Sphaceloma murrayae]
MHNQSVDITSHLSDRLLFAVPKKGRLNEQSLQLLAGSDIQFHRHNRLDIALVKNLPIALVFLPAADIPTFVGKGNVDLGITGRDQVAEHYDKRDRTRDAPGGRRQTIDGAVVEEGVEEVMDLGFGKCKLQVQVPEVTGMVDPKELVGKDVVTSYVNLVEEYFRGLEEEVLGKEGVNGDGTRKLKTRIEYVGGSVEAACAMGVADGIVDLVESGETMRASGLKAISTVFESSAVLIRSKRPSNVELIDLITSRIRGVITAQRFVLCTYNVERSVLDKAVKITPGKRAPTVTSLEDANWVAVSAMVERSKVAIVMDQIMEIGGTDILITKIENSRAT